MADHCVTPCRLLIDPPADGAWNMAVDEALWRGSAQGGGCCWRFYAWSRPTLSLGYFQSYDDRGTHRASRDCPAVRRPSGGGAIVHDNELTYSLVLPTTHPLAARRSPLYEAVHAALIDALGEIGVVATLCRRRVEPPARQALLCFQRRTPGDVLLGDAKIAGSAQRRSRAAVLQHGSVLLARSCAAPELAGIEDLAPVCLAPAQLISAWLPRLSRRLGLVFQPDALDRAELRQAEMLVQTKYGSPRWTRGRGREGPDTEA